MSSMLSANLELTHPCDRDRLHEVGISLFEASLLRSGRIMPSRNAGDAVELFKEIEGNIGCLLMCVGDGRFAGEDNARNLTIRLLTMADDREGVELLGEMAKVEILTTCFELEKEITK